MYRWSDLTQSEAYGSKKEEVWEECVALRVAPLATYISRHLGATRSAIPTYPSNSPSNMADFGFSSSPSSSSGGGMDSAKRSELMDQVKSQLLVAQLQELLSVSYRGRAVYM